MHLNQTDFASTVLVLLVARSSNSQPVRSVAQGRLFLVLCTRRSSEVATEKYSQPTDGFQYSYISKLTQSPLPCLSNLSPMPHRTRPAVRPSIHVYR